MADKKEKKEDKNKKVKENNDKKQKSENKLISKQPITPQKPQEKFSSRIVLIEPLTTEKAIRQIELENKIAFIVNRKATKEEIKRELEQTFKAKVIDVNTQIRNNKKIAFIKLKEDTPAIDIATKLGLM